MNIIIAAIVGGAVLLWGGIAGLLKMVDLFERKHILLLGAYTTLIVSCVMGLVLYTNYERQKEHRQELQEQMNEFSRRLNQLSERLVSQLEEKADLTASEFEIRVKLQNEERNHARTQALLEANKKEYHALKQTLDGQLAAQRQYQEQINQEMAQRFQQEETRYQALQQSTEGNQRTLQATQRQLTGVQQDLSRLNNETAALQKTQTNLLARVNSNQQAFESKNQELTQKVETLARNQDAFHQDLNTLKTQVDSLYNWTKK